MRSLYTGPASPHAAHPHHRHSPNVACAAVRLQTPPPQTTTTAPQTQQTAADGPPTQQHTVLHPPPPAENNALLWSSRISREAAETAPSPPSNSLDSDKALNKQIVACSSWRALRDLLHDHAQHMNTIHVSALVSRLAKVAHSPAVHYEREHSTAHSSNSTAHASSINSRSNNASSSASSSSTATERRALDQFMGEVSQLVSSRLDSFDARALSNTLWAVAKLGFCPSHGLLQRFLFSAYVSMHAMAPQELSNLAWALATMHIYPGRPWVSRLLHHVRANARGMRAQELAHCTWALQQLLEAHKQVQEQARLQTQGQETQQQCVNSQQQQQQTQQQTQNRGTANAPSSQVLSTVPFPAPLEPLFLGAMHAIQQSAEAGLADFKAREMMMLMLSLHRLRLRLLLVGGKSLSGQEREGPTVTDMMASYHRLLSAALQGQLTQQLHKLSPLDVCNLASLAANDIKLQRQAVQKQHTYHTWHMIMGQRALAQLVRGVVMDSHARMTQYSSRDLLSLVSALSTIAHAIPSCRLPPAWLNACASKISSALLTQAGLSLPSFSATKTNTFSDSSSSSNTGAAHSLSDATPSLPDAMPSVQQHQHQQMVEHTSSLPDAMPPLQQQQHQQMVEHTSLVTLLCGLARLGAKGGAGCSDDVGSSNKGSSSSEISSREYSSRSASKGSRTESRSSVDASKGSSSSVDSNDTDSSSSSTTTSANTRTGLQGSNCELQPAVMRLLHLCAVSALPRLSGGKLAVVAWAMAELQAPWDPKLKALLLQRLEQQLIPSPSSLPISQAATAPPLTALSSAAAVASPSAVVIAQSSTEALPQVAETAPRSSTAAAPPQPSPSLTPQPSAATPLSLSEVTMLLYAVERLHLQLQPHTAQALACAAAAAASVATGVSFPAAPVDTSPDEDTAAHTDGGTAHSSSAGLTAVTHALDTASKSAAPATDNDRGAEGSLASSVSSVISSSSSINSSISTNKSLHPKPVHHPQPPSTDAPLSSLPLPSQHDQHQPVHATTHTPAQSSHASLKQTPHVSSTQAQAKAEGGQLKPVIAQELAGVLISLCHMQARTRAHVLSDPVRGAYAHTSVLEHALITNARGLLPQQLSSLVLALGQAQGHLKVHCSNDLMTALLQQASHKMPSFGPPHMTRLLIGLARMKCKPPSWWMMHTLSHAQALLPHCSVEEASSIMWALAKMRVVPPRPFLESWLHHLFTYGLQEDQHPRAAVRSLWALQALRLKLPGQNQTLLVQAAIQSAHRLTPAESLWLLRVSVSTQQFLPHEDWGRLLLIGVLRGREPNRAVAAMPLKQQHLLLTCMAHPHMRWARCWDTWRVIWKAMKGFHSGGATGLIGQWRRFTRPRTWERRSLPLLSKKHAQSQRILLSVTWKVLKASEPRQFCSIERHRERYWDK